MLKHYVEFSCSGSFITLHNLIEEIPERNPELVALPDGAFSYRFFDQAEIIDGEDRLVGKRTNISSWTYFGTAYTLEQVKAHFPELSALISNMKTNHWTRVVKTRTGVWNDLGESDIVIDI